jgi:hypothetical protein
MGKEDLGLLVTTISIYKTIDESYFIGDNNGHLLLETLETSNYSNNNLNTRGKQFFEDIFNNFVCTENHILDLDMIRRKIYILKHISITIEQFFLKNTSLFTKEEIQDFYTKSYSCIINLEMLINYIEYKQESLNTYEFNKITDIQNDLRDYVLYLFWDRYFTSLSSNTNLYEELNQINNISNIINPTIRTVVEHHTINDSIKLDMISIYNKKKTPYFDFINYNSSILKHQGQLSAKKAIYLYSYCGIDKVLELKNPVHSHNLLCHALDNKNDFISNSQEEIYHVKYDDNGLREKDIHNIFIYGYSLNQQKKILVGFAFYDNTHYNNSFNNYNGYIKNDNINNNLLSNLVFSFQPSTFISIDNQYKDTTFDFENRELTYENTRLLIENDNIYTFFVSNRYNKTLGIIQYSTSDNQSILVSVANGIFKNFLGKHVVISNSESDLIKVFIQ